MARIGVDNFRYGILDVEKETYGGALKIGKAIDVKTSLDLNSAELYADNGLAESDYSFKKGNVTITFDHDDDETQAKILGHTYTDGEIIRKDTDTPPYIGFGRVITMVHEGEYSYKAEFLCKVKFKETIPDETTKGESTEYSTPSQDGVASKLSDGTWSRSKTFETKDEAITYLEGLLGTE